MNRKKVLVAGSGKSGMAAAGLLLAGGSEVILYDGNEKLDPENLKAEFAADAKLTVLLGELRSSDLTGVQLAVISPGIPLDVPFVSVLREAQVPIWGEIQLAFHTAKGKLAAITGTNGKTTTTALTGEIMKTFYQEVFVVGNIGIPYTEVALDTTEQSVTIAEVSSFQLETITDFHPNVSAILNVTPDHLNRHGTMENYTAIKERVTENQTAADTVVLNYDDEALRAFGLQETLQPDVFFFSSRQVLEDGLYLDGEKIMYAHDGMQEEVLKVGELQILGRHNYENVMAAVAISLRMGVPLEYIVKACRAFQAVEHRIEFTAERNGVKYYNDSKGTNPDAAIQAIRAMPGPTVLIAGGYDKHSEYDEWIEECNGKVKFMVLMGQTRDKIADCARAHGFREIAFAESMEEAVRICAEHAQPGDQVLLSPACASWGMFDNYEQRGRIFKECVRAL